MNGDITLVVMAAGMGSRFGGLKQIEPIGKNGEILLDYSVYDAVKAGFNKVVFVIKHAIEADFKAVVGKRIEKMVKTEYVFQETDALPEGFVCPPDRVKPWGTAHAVLCCRDVVKEPFAVINADDYYGKSAFNKTADFEQFKLSYNYRSYQEIIDYAVTVYLAQKEKTALEENCYITEVMWTGPSDIKCSRGHGGTVVVANPFGRVIKITQDGVSRVASLVNEFKEIMSDRPMILCRTNRQVKAINEAGYFEASTIHQAKGLEYTNVVVIDTTISCTEDLNIAYVALTRARDKMLVINWNQFELLFNMYMR